MANNDLTHDILPILQNHRLPGLPFEDGMIHPFYEGYSSLNIPSSVCALFGAPLCGASPLDATLLDPIKNGIHNVILLLIDGLSYFRLQRYLADGQPPIWANLLHSGLMAPITAIAPSTTASALTSLWTGRSTREHGITGYEVWLKEYGVTANMISQGVMNFRNDIGGLRRAGFEPETFLPVPTLGAHLTRHGIHPYALIDQSIAHSGLSLMHMPEVDVISFMSQSDLWINLQRLLEERSRQRKYIWIYWGDMDEVSHRYGPDDRRVDIDFGVFCQLMQQLFIDELPAHARQKTLFILTADHGFIKTPRYTTYELRKHPELTRNLTLMPTGENRMAFLFPRSGKVEAVQEYINETWPDDFYTISSANAIQSGLFGSGSPHPHLEDRLGDLTVLARGDRYLWWADKDNMMRGRHGGLSAEEMLIPFFATRL